MSGEIPPITFKMERKAMRRGQTPPRHIQNKMFVVFAGWMGLSREKWGCSQLAAAVGVGGGMLDIKREQKKKAHLICPLPLPVPSLFLSFPTLLHCSMLLSSAIGVQQCFWWWSRVDKGVEWQVVVEGDDLATDGHQELE